MGKEMSGLVYLQGESEEERLQTAFGFLCGAINSTDTGITIMTCFESPKDGNPRAIRVRVIQNGKSNGSSWSNYLANYEEKYFPAPSGSVYLSVEEQKEEPVVKHEGFIQKIRRLWKTKDN